MPGGFSSQRTPSRRPAHHKQLAAGRSGDRMPTNYPGRDRAVGGRVRMPAGDLIAVGTDPHDPITAGGLHLIAGMMFARS